MAAEVGGIPNLSELFELEIAGEHIERRYRRMRPEVEGMPWGTLDLREYPPDVLLAARRSWTGAAFQEHRTGVACALTLKALLEARAPLDLIAFATRFPLDELVHVELCARLAMEIGGAVELRHDPYHLVYEPPHDMSPLMRASELVVHNFCVGEALSIPLLRGTQQAADHPLRDMLYLKLRATINTDDPSVSNINLTDEYELSVEDLGLTQDDVKIAILTAADCSFQPPPERERLVMQFKHDLGLDTTVRAPDSSIKGRRR